MVNNGEGSTGSFQQHGVVWVQQWHGVSNGVGGVVVLTRSVSFVGRRAAA